MRNLILAVPLPAAPQRVFDLYLDPVGHAAFTGGPAVVSARAGTPFSAFGGMLTGTMLHVEPHRQIVQTWRSGNWPADALDSILILTFWLEPAGSRVEVLHLNVPDSDFAGVSDGWQKYYWSPLRAYLQANPAP